METIYAYTAGIVDGEGSIRLDPYKGMWRPSLEVTSTDRELLEFLKETWGGTISTKKVYSDKHRQSYAWAILNKRALDILEMIEPYLQINRKRERARLLVNEYTACTPRNGKYTDEMLVLKKDLVERLRAI